MAPATHHLSFGEQALRYFDRPHETIATAPIDDPAAWRGSDVAARADWVRHFTATEIAELDDAVAAVRARGIELASIGREDFPLPTLAPQIARWAAELGRGRGFLLLRGLPVTRWGDETSAIAYWGLGQHLGEPGAQNPAGDLLGHVTDLGEAPSAPYVRRYRTAGDIAYHCDLADVVGLLCLRGARAGGASRIASSVTVFNELLAQRPDLVPRLFEPICLDTRDEGGGPTHVPVVPCRFNAGRLSTFYHSDYFRSAVRHPDVPALTSLECTLLDLYEEIANRPDVALDMCFEPGDLQLISNHVVVHARFAYVDWPEASRRRHLLRLWLSLRP